MKPVIVAVWNDKHTNSTVALCPPTFRHDDQWSSVISRYQQWLWDCWLDYIGQVKKAARGCALIGIENGDSLDVDEKNRSNQFISRNHVDVVNMAYEADKPLLNLCDRFYLIRGTGAHEGHESEYARMLAEKAGAENVEGAQALWSLLLNVNDVLIEATHHAIGGFRKASFAQGAITRLAEETVIEYASHHERVPDIVLRGHVHKFSDSYDAMPGCRALTVGAWQLHTEHSHRVGHGMRLSDIGALIIKIDNGHYEIDKIRYKPQRQRTVKHD